MKSSVSAPNLSSGMAPPSPPLKRCVRMHALPVNIDEVPSLVLQELQTEAVLHVSGLQAGVCALSSSEFPAAVLDQTSKSSDKTLDMAACLMTPGEHENISRPSMPRPFSTSYLDLCETNELVNQRYIRLLASVRRKRTTK
jgi:hypothetical protein